MSAPRDHHMSLASEAANPSTQFSVLSPSILAFSLDDAESNGMHGN
jgi:hypothetical protein